MNIFMKESSSLLRIYRYTIATQKINKMVMCGYDASCPQEKLGNSMARAQFIVPLQHNYNQSYFLRDKRYKI